MLSLLPCASSSAAPGTGESAALGAGESTLYGTAPTEALHTFTLDSGASRSFFHDSTTLTPLSRPVAVSLADPSGGPVLANSSTVLPCPATPSGLLSGLHLPSFSMNLVSGADLQDASVDHFAPGGQRVTHSTCSRTGRHLATFTRLPGSSLYTLTTSSPPVSASGQVATSSQVFAAASRSSPASAPCSCHPLSHETLLWQHRLGHPSLPRLQGMASRTLVSGLPRSLPPLPLGPAPTCVPCVEGRQHAAPHSSSFPPTEAPLQTLHMDVWGPARVRGQGHERYFLLVVDDYSRYTTVFPLRSKGEVPEINLLPRVSLPETTPNLRWTGKVGDASTFRVWGSRAFVRDTSADKPSSCAVPCVFLGFPPETPGWQFYHPTSRRVLSSQDVTFDESMSYYRLFPYRTASLPPPPLFLAAAFVRDTSADKPSSCAVPCVFLGFPPETPGWQFYHPTSRRVLSSQGVTFDESVSYYHLFPYQSASLPPPPLFLAPGTPPVDLLPPQGPAPLGVSQVDPAEPVEVAVDSGAARVAEPAGAGTGGAEPGGAEPERVEPGSAEPERVEFGGAELERVEPGGAEPASAESGGSPGVPLRREPLSPLGLREWYARRCRRATVAAGAGATGGAAGAGAAGAAGLGGARTGGTGAAGAGCAARVGAACTGAGGATGVVTGDPGACRLREWYARRCRRSAGIASAGAAGGAAGAGAAGGAAGAGATGGAAGAGGAGGAAGAGAAGSTAGAGATGGAAGGAAGAGAASDAAGAESARTGGTGVAGAGGAVGVGAAGTGASGAAGVVPRDPRAEGTGAVSAVSGGAARPRLYYVPLLQQVLGLPPSPGPPPPLLSPPLVQSQSQLQPASPLPGPSPYSGPTRGLTERREPESRPVSPESRFESPVCTVRAGRRVSRLRPPPVPGTHSMTLRPSTAPQRVPLPSPHASSLPDGPDPESDSLGAASPIVTRFLATAVTDPLFESTAASALVAELVDFAAACCLDYATSLVAESASASVCPPSVGGECALGTDVLEDRQEEFECFATAVPHLVSMLLAPEGDPDAPNIPTPRSYAEAIEGPYSSQWQAAMDAEMASWKSTGTYVDEVSPPGANIVSGMWIFAVKRPPGSPPVFKARNVARGFSQRQGVDFFQTFSPTPKMTTLRVLLHVAAQRDYELHSLDFSTAFLQGSLHEGIWLRRPPSFTGSFPAGTQWSLRRPVYGLRHAPHEWHDTLRTTLAALGFAPSTADPSLFLSTDTTLPPFYVLVYVDDLVLQRVGFTYSSPQSTPLPTGHSLSAPPSDESVEPSGPYPELVSCLMYLITCTRPDLAYPLSLLARYVAPGRHRKVHWDAAKRVLRYLCSTSGMGLVLGGRARVVLTSQADASWVDDLATQRSSQGYTFSLGSDSVSWRSTRSSSVLSFSCEAQIYAGAMAAQELRWLTYLLTDLGEAPHSPPVLYVDNKAMLARSGAQTGAQNKAHCSALLPCSRVAAAWSASSCLRGLSGQHC
ncbi:unnamed protein product [Closterium sp. NIES-54]